MQTMSAHIFAWYRHVFSYDSETGIVTRKYTVDCRGKYHPCSYPVTTGNGKGHLTARLLGKTRLVHRMAWEMYYGTDAPEQIDHENQIKDDNRICNLRAATASGNAGNRRYPLRPGCAYRGVSFESRRKTYKATIRVHGRTIFLGTNKCPEVLAHAYNKAAIQFHGEFALLNVIGGVYDE